MTTAAQMAFSMVTRVTLTILPRTLGMQKDKKVEKEETIYS